MNNSSGKNFLLLLVGFGMLGVGLYMFFSKLHLDIGPYWWGFFGQNTNVLGILFIPFILGIVLWVFFTDSIWPKILTWVSVITMIVSVVTTLRPRYSYDAFSTITTIILIFVGGALVLKKMYLDSPKKSKKDLSDEN